MISVNRWPLLAAVAAGLVLTATDMYVIAGVLPSMVTDLEISSGHLEQATPLLTGFLAAYMAAIAVAGPIADRYGVEPVYLGGLAIFGVGSVLTAAADQLALAVLGRTLQGLAGGSLVPVAFAVAARFAARQQGRAVGLATAAQELGSVVGPVYGAAVVTAATRFAGWRLIFWLNIPLAAFAAAAFAAARRRSTSATAATARAGIDWAGAALLACALGLAVIAVYPDRPAASATGTHFWVLFPPALGLFGLFVLRQRTAVLPLLPPRALEGARSLLPLAAIFLAGAALAVGVVNLPLLGRLVFDLDELGAAGLLARFMVLVPIGAALGGWAHDRVGVATPAAIGLLAAAGAFWLMSDWTQAEPARHLGPVGEIDLVLPVAGLGLGLALTPLTIVVLDVAGLAHRGATAGLAVLTRTGGMLAGVSLLGAVGLHRFYELLEKGPALTARPGSPEFARQSAAVGAWITSSLVAEYQQVFRVTAVLCLAAALIAVAAEGIPRRKAKHSRGAPLQS